MCPRSCIAYTGPYEKLERCPKCREREPRYYRKGKKKIPRQTFDTHLVGPQLQALFLSREHAERMHHRRRLTKRLIDLLKVGGTFDLAEDAFYGSDYLDAAQPHGDEPPRIKPEDICLMFSVDGAQLYRMKQSDCWIYIWVIFDLAPELRYKNRYILPGAIIPGPNNPKDLDSFLLPGLYHIAALQREG
ncbi:hypothetical protein OH76DRAFT_1341657 [Lentinus brumalis]|uniref:Uncharacterized protein n=1 Tax=Lentinus brumalis TaxID=2498619 RepID=A0A371DNV4_9APHY|nr:hypothetical protein OH76DRAFT_1341657 [Polyporus brumalis]